MYIELVIEEMIETAQDYRTLLGRRYITKIKIQNEVINISIITIGSLEEFNYNSNIDGDLGKWWLNTIPTN